MIRRTFILGLLALAACDDNGANGVTGRVDPGPDRLGPAPEVAATPEFDPPEGAFARVPVVTIRTATPGATIHYTMNGSTPDATSPIYTLPLAMAKTTTLKAIARRPGSRDSEVGAANFNVDIASGDVAPVHFEPNTGRYSNDVHVTLSSTTAGATLCYTTDGSRPACEQGPVCTGTSLPYEAPVILGRSEQKIRAIACKRGTGQSTETGAVYTFKNATPTTDPPVEHYDPLNPVPITITSETEGATIHYTLDGTWPDCNSPSTLPNGSQLPLLTADTKVWAIACKDGYEPSETSMTKYLGTTCVGDLYATTQAELDALSRCREIAGSLMISGDTVTDLTPLNNLRRVERTLALSGTHVEEWVAPSTLTSVRWLDIWHTRYLRHVGGFSGLTQFTNGGVTVRDNAELTTFDALHGVTTIDGSLDISQNAKLTHLELPNLKSAREVQLYQLPALASLDGLRSMTHVEQLGLSGQLGFSNLKGLEQLTSLDALGVRNSTGLVSLAGLDNVTAVRSIDIYQSALESLRGLDKVETFQMLDVTQNDRLTEIGSLNAVNSALASLRIGGNPKLSHLNGFHGLRSTGEILLFSNKALTKLDGFDQLEHLTHDLYVSDNALGSLDGLHALLAVDENVVIGQEPSLTGLSGLGALQTIGGGLLIAENPALLRVDGLAQLTKLRTSLNIRKNAVLPPCQAEGLAKKLVELGFTGGVTLGDNNGTGTCN